MVEATNNLKHQMLNIESYKRKASEENKAESCTIFDALIQLCPLPGFHSLLKCIHVETLQGDLCTIFEFRTMNSLIISF